jgi:hypothetical protein
MSGASLISSRGALRSQAITRGKSGSATSHTTTAVQIRVWRNNAYVDSVTSAYISQRWLPPLSAI